MEKFRKIYYKITLIVCMASTFVYLFNVEGSGIGYGCFYMLIGLLCFGSWAIGKETIDPDKPIRNILALLLWSLVGFGMMATGVVALIDGRESETFIMVFLVLTALALMVAYVVSIIKNKDWFAIASVVLFIGGLVLGGNSTGRPVLAVLTLVTLFAALVVFVISMFRGLEDD